VPRLFGPTCAICAVAMSDLRHRHHSRYCYPWAGVEGRLPRHANPDRACITPRSKVS
jgi:hypothetical protein